MKLYLHYCRNLVDICCLILVCSFAILIVIELIFSVIYFSKLRGYNSEQGLVLREVCFHSQKRHEQRTANSWARKLISGGEKCYEENKIRWYGGEWSERLYSRWGSEEGSTRRWLLFRDLSATEWAVRSSEERAFWGRENSRWLNHGTIDLLVWIILSFGRLSYAR